MKIDDCKSIGNFKTGPSNAEKLFREKAEKSQDFCKKVWKKKNFFRFVNLQLLEFLNRFGLGAVQGSECQNHKQQQFDHHTVSFLFQQAGTDICNLLGGDSQRTCHKILDFLVDGRPLEGHQILHHIPEAELSHRIVLMFRVIYLIIPVLVATVTVGMIEGG